MNKKFQNIFIIILILFSYFILHRANAGLVSNFSDQLNSQVIATAANHIISFTISSDFGPNETLKLYFENGFDLSRIDYTDIDFLDDGANKNLGASPGSGVAGNIGAVISGQTLTLTQNDTDTVSAGSIITVLIGTNATHQTIGDQQAFNPGIAGTYKLSLSGTFGDYGTISIQILSADTVGFKATIEPSLSFIIRNSDDSGMAAGCSLGVVSKSTLSQCSYRLAVDTNNPKGFQLWIAADGNLRNANGSIANIAENASVTIGTEGYGLALVAGTGITESNDFNDDDTPLPVGNSLLISTNSVYNYIQGDLSTSSLITLKAAIAAETKAGSYSQLITYSILGNY